MIKKILIIGPSWVGDTVMAQSLFKLLKARDTNVIIEVLAPAWTFSLLSRMPEVSQAIEMPLTHGELKLRERFQLAKKIKDRCYHQAIILPNSFKSALIPWLAKIPVRTGWLGECRYVILNDIRYLDKKHYPLMIQQYLALGVSREEALPSLYPYPAFAVDEASQAMTLAKHQLSKLPNKPILALCAGAEFGPSKRWPEEYYAAVANKQLAEGWAVWLFGSYKDRPVTEKIMALTEYRCENLSGKVELAETIDLLSVVTGVISNDSGLMHVAAALKKPVIAIYGSTSPVFTPPLSEQATVLKLNLDCQPCFERECPLGHHRCLRDLTPEKVLAALANWGPLCGYS